MSTVIPMRRPRMRDDDSKEIEQRKRQKLAQSKPKEPKIPRGTILYFGRLPIETLQKIAHNLLEDEDLESFKNSCHKTFAAIEGDSGSFWRERFLATFDPTNAIVAGSRCFQNGQYRAAYKSRQAFKDVPSLAFYNMGATKARAQANKMIETIKVMISDAIAVGFAGSKNQSAIEEITKGQQMDIILWNPIDLSNFLTPCVFFIGQLTTHPHYNMVQVFRAPTIIEESSAHYKVFGGLWSLVPQRMTVYGSRRVNAMFNLASGEIDFGVMIDHLQFWRYYLCRDKSRAITTCYTGLPSRDKPKQVSAPWRQNHSSWISCFSMVDEEDFDNVVRGMDTNFKDLFGGTLEDDRPFDDIELMKVKEGEHFWPPEFERELPTEIAIHGSQDEKIAARRVRLMGGAWSGKEACGISGWILPLPAQSGMPGWRRVVLVRYLQDENTGYVDCDMTFVFEGVLLPVSDMIIGRWWSGRGFRGHAWRHLTGAAIYWRTRDF